MSSIPSINTNNPTLWETSLFLKSVSYLEYSALLLSKPIHFVSQPSVRAIFTPIRPGKEGNLNSASLELIWRVFIITICVLTAPLTMGLALGGGILYKIADCIKQKPFTSIKGNAEEKLESKNRKLMTLNACAFWGGLPIPLGGISPPTEQRLDALAQLIKEKDPDVLMMQEMAFDPAMRLIPKIKNNFAHFYTRIGPNPPLMESGLFVATKYPVINAGFIQFPDQCGINRGAFWIETKKSVYFTTHMEFGHDEEGILKRQNQFELIKEKVKAFEKQGKTCFLLGDLNVDRAQGNEAYQKMGISEVFYDPYFKKHPQINEKSSTCTNVICNYILGKKPPTKPFEMVDYALQGKGGASTQLDVELCRDTYKNDKPDEALTDHRLLVLRVKA